MPRFTTPEMQANPMSPEQEMCKDFILNTKSCGLFLGMGSGKTRITLEALWDMNPNCHVLIIAPKTIARSVWTDEMEKWGMKFRTKSFIVNEKGKQLTSKKRHELYEEALNEPPTVYFINRELIPDLVKNCPVKNGAPIWMFPIVIIDELQSFKSHKAERFKALKQVLPCVDKFIGLTGTPTPKGLMDLWSEIYLMDNGKRLGMNITTYRNTFFRPGRIINGYPIEYIPLPGAEQEIYRRINDIVISVKNSNIKLPTLTMNNIYAHLTPQEEKLYKNFMKTQVFDTESGDTIEAANAAVLTAKLSQMASGAIYTDPKNHKFQIIHSQKLELCEYIVRNTDGPVIIAYHFQSDKDMLLAYFQGQGLDARLFDKSPEMIAEWNKGNIPIMLIQPASAGHGLNLQAGGNTLIWYTIPWSLEEYQQTNARLYRQGQTKPVTIHHIMTKGTIDERILQILEKKDTSQRALLDAVKQTVI